MEKEWGGNKKTMGVTLGASNHSEGVREENDFYATNPKSLELFLDNKQNDFIIRNPVWEPSCGIVKKWYPDSMGGYKDTARFQKLEDAEEFLKGLLEPVYADEPMAKSDGKKVIKLYLNQ